MMNDPLNSRTGDAAVDVMRSIDRNDGPMTLLGCFEQFWNSVPQDAGGRIVSAELWGCYQVWRLQHPHWTEMEAALFTITELAKSLAATKSLLFQRVSNEAVPRYYDSACRDCTLCGGLGVDGSGGGSCRKCGGNGKGSR